MPTQMGTTVQGDRLQDRYPNISKFEIILDDADMAASGSKEEDFVLSVKLKYQSWGGRMYWSDKQDKWLRSIAGEDY